MKTKSKIGILNLGCPRNLVDSESIMGRLVAKGYRVSDMADADVGILNTCAFIEDAKIESIDAILDLINLKKRGQLKKILVYGCLAQRYKDVLKKEFPQIDAVVGRVPLNHYAHSYRLTPKHFAYLKICEGCVNACSFCVIPKLKGKFNSLAIDSVLDKVKMFDKERVSEVNIIGQDISGYGIDIYGAAKLDLLLKKILKNAKFINWFRLLYLYPGRISDELLDIIRDEPRVCKYIDVPVQHINSRILKLMGRHTSKKDICLLLDKIRHKIPQVALRTSLIVGFPSETDTEFKELLSFVRERKFERLGAFIYSREEDTPAFGLAGHLPTKVKVSRFDAIMSAQQQVSRMLNLNFIGKELDVIIDEAGKDYYLGRTQYDAPEVDGMVYVKSAKSLGAGSFVKVKITDTLEYDLVGVTKE